MVAYLFQMPHQGSSFMSRDLLNRSLQKFVDKYYTLQEADNTSCDADNTSCNSKDLMVIRLSQDSTKRES